MFLFGSLILNIASVVVLLTVTLLTYFYYCYLYWQRKQVPYISPTFPFGSVRLLLFSKESFSKFFHNIYTQFRERGCRYGGFYMFSKPTLLLVDPELIKLILTKDFHYFHDRNLFSNEKIDPLSYNLFAAKGSRWKNLRKNISPVFTSGKMKMMFGSLLKTTEDLVSALEKSAQMAVPISTKETMSKFAMDVIGSCVFGIECNSFKDEETDFRKYAKMFLASTLLNNFKLTVGMVYTKLLQLLQVRNVSPEVTNFYMNVFRESIEMREKYKIHRNDFIELFIKLKNNKNIADELAEKNEEISSTKEAITFNELAAQAFLFFVAGFDATAATISFCLYELSLHQDIQEKTRQNILAALKKHNGQITYESVAQMEYLDKVIEETLRKYPIAGQIIRECTENYKIPGSDVIIEKKTQVMISNMGLHRDPKYYPDPEKFDPERFSQEAKNKRHPFVYLPFGEGPRICIGMRFAVLEIKTALTTLLKNFKFSVHPQTSTPVELSNSGVLLDTKNKIFLQVDKVCN